MTEKYEKIKNGSINNQKKNNEIENNGKKK